MKIAVYGAYGHTARFVLAELLRRGHTAIAIGRDDSKLAVAAAVQGAEIETRVAALDSPESLDRALSGVDAIVHCAGPFVDTAAPLIEAALRSNVHYFDVTAEQQSALSTFERFDEAARDRGVCIVPAAGFYGGFGDVLATHAMSGFAPAKRIDIAVALDRWWPTRGTRLTGQRNSAPRLVFSDGKLVPMQRPATASWNFPEPFGAQRVVELPFTETVLIARHLPVREIRHSINERALSDVRDPATPVPDAADERGRSRQHFVIDVQVRSGGEEHRVTAQGRDIYAVTAPIVVEAVDRVCRGARVTAGAFALGQIVDAPDFLETLVRLGEIRVARSCHPKQTL